MKKILLSGLFLSVVAFGGSCPTDYKDFNAGTNRLYRDCYCKTVVPPEAVVIADSLRMAVKSDTSWSEEADGTKWYKCILVFSFKDRATKKSAECKTLNEQLQQKLKSTPALSNYAWNTSFVMCQ